MKKNWINILYPSLNLFEKFNKKTKIEGIDILVNFSNWPKSWKTIYFKGYPRLDHISLPKPALPKKNIRTVFTERHSFRDFQPNNLIKLTKREISTLLYYSAGLKQTKKTVSNYRFYPSAGGRYPLEVYFISHNTEYLRGVYHYYLRNHSIERLTTIKSHELKKCFLQKWVVNASILILITAIFDRTASKYGNRGYRYILQESGHLAQNIYLICAALDLRCCAIGGFRDDIINSILDIDGIKESIIYVLACG